MARRWPYDDPAALESMQKLLASSTRVGLVLGVFVVIPVAREVFFRGVLFGELERDYRRAGPSRRGGGGLPGCRLPGDHAPLHGLLARLALDARALSSWASRSAGCALRTGSLVAPVVAHLAFWSVEGIPILRGADPAADVTYLSPVDRRRRGGGRRGAGGDTP